MNSGIGERLKMARNLAGMSQADVAERMELSRMAISKYENEQVLPSSDILIRLAQVLGQPVEFFLRGPQPPQIMPVYRKRAVLRGKKRAAVISQLQAWLERYLAVESLFPPQELIRFTYPNGFPYLFGTITEVEKAAEMLREEWELGDAPIDNLTELLEDRGIKVGMIEGRDGFDACLFHFDNNTPFMAVRAGIPGDRQRFSLAHELGHIMLRPIHTLDSEIPDEEKAAMRFAGAFLVPRHVAYRELGRRRTSLSIPELHMLKHKYGLSMQAWMYRARDLGIIDDAAARRHFMQFRSNGVYRREPGNAFPEERPQRLVRWVLRARSEGVISQLRASELLGMPWSEFIRQHLRQEDDLIAVGA